MNMPKFTKFSLSPFGELVYRNTGRIAPTAYEIRNKTVYNRGRKIGTIGKGTNAQQRLVATAAYNRVARTKNKGFSYRTLAGLQEDQAFLEPDSITKRQRGALNYAKCLREAVDAGFMSSQKATAMMKIYEAASDTRRRELFDELERYFDEIGFEYLQDRAWNGYRNLL